MWRGDVAPSRREGLPDGGDDGGRGIVRVGRRGACRRVVPFTEQFFQFRGRGLPLRRGGRLKELWQCAPTGVANQNPFLFVGRGPLFPFEELQEPDGFQVGDRLLARRAVSDNQVRRKAEIAGEGGYRGGKLGEALHSWSAISRAALYSIFWTIVSW